MIVLSTLKQLLAEHHGKKFWIAYSGGMDSHVLLHACYRLQIELKLNLNVVHVNHQLNSRAHEWQEHCQKVCDAYQLPLLIKKINIHKLPGDSLEALARKKRYVIFKQILNEDDVLLTAHHQDDQAETLLLQLMRGAGVAGLAAMPEIRRFATGMHMRPFLYLARKTLHEYALQHELQWIDDDSNSLLTIRRNFVRHIILPKLQQLLPRVQRSIARSAKHCAETQELLDEWASEHFADICTDANTLVISRLLRLSQQKQNLILRYWIKKSGQILPSTKKMQQIKKTVLHARSDKNPCVTFGKCEIRRYRDEIYLLNSTKNISEKNYHWDLQNPLQLANLGELHVVKQKGEGLKSLDYVSVRFRTGSEKLFLHGQHKTLKNCMQQWGIPVWLRNQIPLIFYEDKLISVCGYYTDARYSAAEDEEGLVIGFNAQVCHPRVNGDPFV